MRYAQPGTEGSIVSFKSRYGNYIGGEFVAPVKGQYFTNTSPVNGKAIAEFPRSTAEDIDKALDAAHAAADAWGATSVQARSLVLLKIADRIEQNLELLAITETWDNGKAVRETLNADVPLAADHFRYYAGCIRAQEGSAAEIDGNTVAYHIHEPLGVINPATALSSVDLPHPEGPSSTKRSPGSISKLTWWVARTTRLAVRYSRLTFCTCSSGSAAAGSRCRVTGLLLAVWPCRTAFMEKLPGQNGASPWMVVRNSLRRRCAGHPAARWISERLSQNTRSWACH